jgi:hypothetical protein
MSSPTNTVEGLQADSKIPPTQIDNVLRDMGPWHGFLPLPGLAYKWMLAAHIKSQISPKCYEIWAQLLDLTLARGAAPYTARWGERSPYAVLIRKDEKGKEYAVEVHLEHLAALMGIHIANFRAYWREGVEAGIWRNGNDLEGTQRLYLCTEVMKAPEIGPETPDSGVCTYSWEKLPSYVSNDLRQLPPEKQQEFWDGWNARETTVWKPALADLALLGRAVIDEDQDTYIRSFGPQKKRLGSRLDGNKDPEAEARAKRLKALLPAVQEYVHTLRESIQTAPKPAYKPPDKPKNGTATLVGSEQYQRKRERAGESTSPEPSPSSYEPLPAKVVGSPKILPTVEPLVSAPRSSRMANPETPPAPVLTSEEKEAEDLLFAGLRQMQESFPHTNFSDELIDPGEINDQLLVHRILYAVGAANVPDFLSHCWDKFKGLDRNALGKLPPRAPGSPNGPRSFGLILSWAIKYGERLDMAARASEGERARLRACEIDAIHELLIDPFIPPEDEVLYRAMLRNYEQGGLADAEQSDIRGWPRTEGR